MIVSNLHQAQLHVASCCLMLRSPQQCRKIPSCLPPRWPLATPGHATIYSIVTTTPRWPAATHHGHVTIYSRVATTHQCHYTAYRYTIPAKSFPPYCISPPPRMRVTFDEVPTPGAVFSPGFRNRHNHMHRLSSSTNEADSILMQPEPTPWMYRLSSRRSRHPAESETW